MKRLLFLLPALGPAMFGAGPCIPIADNEVRLSHLAGAAPGISAAQADAFVAYTPAPGVERVLSRETIRRVAARAGVSLSLAGDVCIQRAVAPLTRAAVERAIAASGLKAEVVAICPCQVPEGGELELPRSGLTVSGTAAAGTEALWRGRWRYGGTRSLAVWVKVRLAPSGFRLVAAEDIEPGQPVQANQIRLDPTTGLETGGRLAHPEEAIGKIARRRIRKGEPLLTTSLVQPEEVRRGALVEVAVESGGAVLRLTAPAETSGRLGERILVRNPETGRRFRATVRETGKAVLQIAGEAHEK
jgi:flagella basal body P-ring formation protein FlgA